MSETTVDAPETDVNAEQSADQSVDAPDSDVQDQTFYNVHELTRTQPGIYLDVEERRQAEIRHARLQDRDPDFDNMPAGAGTPIVTEAGAKGVLSLPENVRLDAEHAVHQDLPVDVAGVAAPGITSPVPAPADATDVVPTPEGNATVYSDGEAGADSGVIAPGTTTYNAEAEQDEETSE